MVLDFGVTNVIAQKKQECTDFSLFMQVREVENKEGGHRHLASKQLHDLVKQNNDNRKFSNGKSKVMPL